MIEVMKGLGERPGTGVMVQVLSQRMLGRWSVDELNAGLVYAQVQGWLELKRSMVTMTTAGYMAGVGQPMVSAPPCSGTAGGVT